MGIRNKELSKNSRVKSLLSGCLHQELPLLIPIFLSLAIASNTKAGKDVDWTRSDNLPAPRHRPV